MRRPSAETRLIHARPRMTTTAQTVGPSIQRGSTVLISGAADVYDDAAPTYGRMGLATHQALCAALCELEGATNTALFPSGLAAMTTAMTSVLQSGDDILVTDAIYKPTRRFCQNVLHRFGVSVRFHPADLSAEGILALVRPETRLIVMESPGSLTLDMQDVPGVARLASQRGILTLVDNTWAAGALFRPLDHGVDISVQSLTKYACGHSDILMGSATTRRADVAAQLDHSVRDFGWSVSADDAYGILRGLRTLHTRLRQQGESALRVANWLERHAKIARVLYPALPSSHGYEIWRRDYSGAAGLLAFEFGPRTDAEINRFLDHLRIFGLGFSWGGFESLALPCDPQLAVRTFPEKGRGPLIRLSIGLETTDDLIADLEAALAVLP